MSFAKRRDDVLRMEKTGEAPRKNTENRIDFIKIGNQCRYQVEAIERMVEERTIAKET